MPKKFVFIGAGSLQFTRELVRDILTFPVFHDATIALVDINEDNLALVKKAIDHIVTEGKYPAKVIATTDRKTVLEGADGVLTTIRMADDDRPLKAEILIPAKYGVHTCVGDTRGPYAVMRYLRTIPAIMDIVRDIEKYCPKAIYLNYTNPMAMLCRTVQGLSSITASGLCHSVQKTVTQLAGWIGAPEEEITYLCAGINHQAHYLKFDWNGEDAIPLIRQAILTRPEIYNEEIVRNEMFLALGYYVTESSGHNSEYNWWFRKRPELIEQYCHPGTGWNPGFSQTEEMIGKRAYRYTPEGRKQEFDKWMAEPLDLARGLEYAAYIFNACFGDGTLFEFNGNVRNFNLIDNLPYGCCVEIPVEASRAGLRPIRVGALPSQLSALNTINAQCEEMAVEAYLTGDPEKIYWANCFDPLTAAVLSLQEIRSMTREMISAMMDWLPIKHNI